MCRRVWRGRACRSLSYEAKREGKWYAHVQVWIPASEVLGYYQVRHILVSGTEDLLLNDISLGTEMYVKPREATDVGRAFPLVCSAFLHAPAHACTWKSQSANARVCLVCCLSTPQTSHLRHIIA